MHAISHVRIERRKKLHSNVKKYALSINPEEIKTEFQKLGHSHKYLEH
jgi:hypothetical protein